MMVWGGRGSVVFAWVVVGWEVDGNCDDGCHKVDGLQGFIRRP